jgi:DNA-binding response OmpR family regulator
VIILDLMLPGIDGITVCQRLRSDGNNHTPIIMLTARDTLDDRLQGFQVGADDYLIKPFALSELDARINALFRRSQGNRQRTITIADLSYDLDTLEVKRQEKILKLHSTALKLLAVLMQKSPHIVKRETLEQSVWGDNLPDSDSLRSHIHMLRQVIDKPFDKPLLHTVHGLGYRLSEPMDDSHGK